MKAATMPLILPIVEAPPRAVLRTSVGNNSGVYKYKLPKAVVKNSRPIKITARWASSNSETMRILR